MRSARGGRGGGGAAGGRGGAECGGGRRDGGGGARARSRRATGATGSPSPLGATAQQPTQRQQQHARRRKPSGAPTHSAHRDAHRTSVVWNANASSGGGAAAAAAARACVTCSSSGKCSNDSVNGAPSSARSVGAGVVTVERVAGALGLHGDADTGGDDAGGARDVRRRPQRRRAVPTAPPRPP